MADVPEMSKPEFVVYPGDAELPARILENDIFEHPSQYRTVLTLGNMMLQDAMDMGDEGGAVSGDALKQVTDFFGYGYDKDVSFDDATEKAVRADETVQQLIIRRATLSQRSSSSGTENDAQGERIRDEIRHRRLALFVDRVLVWQTLQQAESDNDPKGNTLSHVG